MPQNGIIQDTYFELVKNRDPCFFEAQITMGIQKIFTFSETDLLIKYCCTTRWYFYFVSRIVSLASRLLYQYFGSMYEVDSQLLL